MALIVSLETSTSVSSVALFIESEMIFSSIISIEKSHSGSLAKMINNAVELAGYKLHDLNGVAVSKGPGSYTGLRIGASLAKGLCFALDIPLIAINTLESMAFGMNKFNTQNMLLCPMIDARRMEVYCMVLDHNLNVMQETEAKIIDETSFDELLDLYQIIFFGNGADKVTGLLSKNSNSHFIQGIFPQATHVGALAYQKFFQNNFENLTYFEPFYLKDFIGTKPVK
jgi:tRNA threonylcarbamoyladenosine biosynthesis protein TsaB